MAQRVAVLMKLKDGVTKGEVRELCELLRRIGEPSWLMDGGYDEVRGTENGRAFVHYNRRPKKPRTDEQIVQRYDDEYGDPTFYIP
jgi:hypothetical protein